MVVSAAFLDAHGAIQLLAKQQPGEVVRQCHIRQTNAGVNFHKIGGEAVCTTNADDESSAQRIESVLY